MKPAVDLSIHQLLQERLDKLEKKFNADFFVYYGPIVDGNENSVLRIIEDLASDKNKKDKIFIILTTNGGSAIAVERYVNILRHHYKEVNFIIPDYAYSAGTIFCMSGDNIYMDYFSVLGPIDPQVKNKDGKWVAALGYLDKVNDFIDKAQKNLLTQAEFLILKDLDLAELRGYEQAKNLTIELLKKWLVKYKFKNWDKHSTTNPGTTVTEEQKKQRAEEIADKLSDSNLWKSHSRPIDIKLITKSKLYNGTIDTDNNFQIEVPESIIQEKNILKISYNQIKYGKIIKGSSIHLLSKNDLFSNKTLHADYGMLEIGAVVIVTPTPPDFYYFDGKRISRNKFEKIKKENPNFEYIYLDEEVMTDIITKNAYVGTVYLLYSK
ncbi:hypothetical protein MASR1M29_08170 [Cloacibacterium normanense]